MRQRSPLFRLLVAAAALLACSAQEDASTAESVASLEQAPAAAPGGGPSFKAVPAMVRADGGRPQAGDAAAPAPPAARDAGSGASGAASGIVQDAPAPAMLIRTGSASLEVDSLEVAIAQLTALAARIGGYVANTSLSGGADQLRVATLDLRIPAERWELAMAGLDPIGRLESANTSTEDVGEEYTDLGARVANARRLEERLVQLLATRTGRLEDVLAVERELARVREEIERIEGRMRWLRTRAATSTLSVTVHEPAPLGAPGRSPITDALRQAWMNFVAFVSFLIASLGIVVPLALLIAAAWWLSGPVRRRRRVHASAARPLAAGEPRDGTA